MTDAELNSRFDKLDRTLDKLLKHVVTGFAASDAKMNEMVTKRQMNDVYDLFDKNLMEHEKQEHERAAMNYQLDRHDKQIRQLAHKVGVKLQA